MGSWWSQGRVAAAGPGPPNSEPGGQSALSQLIAYVWAIAGGIWNLPRVTLRDSGPFEKQGDVLGALRFKTRGVGLVSPCGFGQAMNLYVQDPWYLRRTLGCTSTGLCSPWCLS